MKKSFMTRVLATGLSLAMAFSMAAATNVTTASAASKPAMITYDSGASAKTVGDILEKNGLVESAYAFVIQTFLYEADIKPGKYKLNTEFNPAEIIVVLNGSDKDEASE